MHFNAEYRIECTLLSLSNGNLHWSSCGSFSFLMVNRDVNISNATSRFTYLCFQFRTQMDLRSITMMKIQLSDDKLCVFVTFIFVVFFCRLNSYQTVSIILVPF